MLDIAQATDHVTGLLALLAVVGCLYAYKWRRVTGYYRAFGWLTLATVTLTVWANRIAHDLITPRSSIVPFAFVGWTLSAIFVLTLLIVTMRHTRRL